MSFKLLNLNHVLKTKSTEHMDFISNIANILGTSQFIIGLTIFFVCWIGGNLLLGPKHALDPAPFLLASTCINIYSAYTISILLKADRASRDRDEIKNNHEHELNQHILDTVQALADKLENQANSCKCNKG